MLTVHAFVGVAQTLRVHKAGVDLNARMRCLCVKEQQVIDMAEALATLKSESFAPDMVAKPQADAEKMHIV